MVYPISAQYPVSMISKVLEERRNDRQTNLTPFWLVPNTPKAPIYGVKTISSCNNSRSTLSLLTPSLLHL